MDKEASAARALQVIARFFKHPMGGSSQYSMARAAGQAKNFLPPSLPRNKKGIVPEQEISDFLSRMKPREIQSLRKGGIFSQGLDDTGTVQGADRINRLMGDALQSRKGQMWKDRLRIPAIATGTGAAGMVGIPAAHNKLYHNVNTDEMAFGMGKHLLPESYKMPGTGTADDESMAESLNEALAEKITAQDSPADKAVKETPIAPRIDALSRGERMLLYAVLGGGSGALASRAYGGMTGKQDWKRDLGATGIGAATGGAIGSLEKVSSDAEMTGHYHGYKRNG